MYSPAWIPKKRRRQLKSHVERTGSTGGRLLLFCYYFAQPLLFTPGFIVSLSYSHSVLALFVVLSLDALQVNGHLRSTCALAGYELFIALSFTKSTPAGSGWKYDLTLRGVSGK